MRTGRVEADLRVLLDLTEAPAYLRSLIQAKGVEEHGPLPPDAPAAEQIAADVRSLHDVLDQAQESSTLPDEPTAEPVLHDILVRIRLGG
jgi:hypothetical protein